jgi:secreted PhoX family phosphatase
MVAVVSAVALGSATAATAATPGPLVTDPRGIINLPAGFTYEVISESCTPTRSTESGAIVPMPEDFDGNAVINAPNGETWLLSNHEITQPRAGDFQGDAHKAACAPGEQNPAADDGDSDGWGSVSRIVLAKDGTTVLRQELITTGLHNLCAVALTPWKTYLTAEEFPFLADQDRRSGWMWEVDPSTGAATRLDGMGRFSHEQAAYASNGSWYLTEDDGLFAFLYKFVPDRRSDLRTGQLYGLAFNKATGTGVWVGPLNPLNPEADMRARGHNPELEGFGKMEGIVAQGGSWGNGGNLVTFTESGTPPGDPGRVWTIRDLGNDGVATGYIEVEGDWARLSRPDNVRYNDAGDLFIFEDNGSSDFRNHPEAGPLNQIWIHPRNSDDPSELILLASVPFAEGTGPWFSNDGKLFYISVQDQPVVGSPGLSRVFAVRHPTNWNTRYDR